MKILYGLLNNNIDVTNICLKNLTNNNEIIIPSKDINRAKLFSDPIQGKKKSIFIENNNEKKKYDDNLKVIIDISNNKVRTEEENKKPTWLDETKKNLKKYQDNLKIKYGSFKDEYDEQLLAVRYLTGKEKILEIGSNIGRNTLIISSILEDDRNLVTLESDSNIFKKLIENKELNKKNFFTENSALSKNRLIQKKWNTKPSNILLKGYKWVNTITFEELKKKYNINFDTLILDCEGAFYYILKDMPEIINNIKLIIVENDYDSKEHKEYVDSILKNNNFYLEYSKNGNEYTKIYMKYVWKNFYEVWKKKDE